MNNPYLSSKYRQMIENIHDDHQEIPLLDSSVPYSEKELHHLPLTDSEKTELVPFVSLSGCCSKFNWGFRQCFFGVNFSFKNIKRIFTCCFTIEITIYFVLLVMEAVMSIFLESFIDWCWEKYVNKEEVEEFFAYMIHELFESKNPLDILKKYASIGFWLGVILKICSELYDLIVMENSYIRNSNVAEQILKGSQAKFSHCDENLSSLPRSCKGAGKFCLKNIIWGIIEEIIIKYLILCVLSCVLIFIVLIPFLGIILYIILILWIVIINSAAQFLKIVIHRKNHHTCFITLTIVKYCWNNLWEVSGFGLGITIIYFIPILGRYQYFIGHTYATRFYLHLEYLSEEKNKKNFNERLPIMNYGTAINNEAF